VIDDVSLELLYPMVAWRSPLLVKHTDGASGYACRLCIAQRGLSANEIHELPQDPELVRAHLAIEHPWSLVEALAGDA